MTNKPPTARELALRWGISRRVADEWRADGVPLESDDGTVAWFTGLDPNLQARKPPAFRKKIAAIRAAKKGPATVSPGDDAAYKAFEAKYESEENNDQTALAVLKKQQAFYLAKHRAASESDDEATASSAMKQIKELSSVIHDMELRAQKLGRDMGDLVPRKDLETPARFLGYHLLRCADAALTSLAKALTERDPSLPPPTAEEIVALGEPLFLRAVVFDPMQRATAGDNEAAPPAWLVDALRDGMTEVVEQTP